MISKEKMIEVSKQLDEISVMVRRNWDQMADTFAESGAVPSDYEDMGNFWFAKAVVDAWCVNRNYSPLTKAGKKEFANIRHFI
jgi:hypothetical protein